MAGCKPIVISSWILLFLLILLTEAAFYPTKPIANTTYVAGQAALVTWVEDGVEPHISSLGRMTIDLYAGRNTFLAKVAEHVDPLAFSTTIFIPSSVIPVHYYRFNLRFKAASPANSSAVLSRSLPRPRLSVSSIVVYTADFNIIPNPLSVQNFPTSTKNATKNHHFTTPSLSAYPTQSPSPSLVSRLAPVPTASRIEKGKSGALGRRLRVRGGMQDAGVIQMMIGVRTVTAHHDVNGEEMKFRLAFIVWPALIGLSMAV